MLMATKKQKEKFLDVVNKFFKEHGIKNPAIYLADRAGVTHTQIYWVFGAADKAVSIKTGDLDPKWAVFFIYHAELLLKGAEIFNNNPIENFLQPKLNKFYKEQDKKTNGRK
jgi:hypothetical protein